MAAGENKHVVFFVLSKIMRVEVIVFDYMILK